MKSSNVPKKPLKLARGSMRYPIMKKYAIETILQAKDNDNKAEKIMKLIEKFNF